jgi:hypothetical protein
VLFTFSSSTYVFLPAVVPAGNKLKTIFNGAGGRTFFVNNNVGSACLSRQALRVRLRTSLKNHKWAKLAKEWPTHSSLSKYIYKKDAEGFIVNIFVYKIYGN